MICCKCRKAIDDGSVYCRYCGKKQISTPARKALKRPNGTGTVYKLSGRRKRPWVASITIGYDSNTGKRENAIIDYYATKTEALQALEKAAGQPVSPKRNYTLAEVYEEWKTVHFKEISIKGIEGYTAAWKYYDKYKNEKIRELRTAHFQKVIDGATEIGRSRSTCEKIKQLSNQLSKYAMQNDIIDKNYSTFTKLPKTDAKKKGIFTDEEINILFEHDDDQTVRIILTLIYTGFRIGELFELTKNNVYLQEGYMIGGFKTEAGTNRTVPINRKIRPYIEAWYDAKNIPTADKSKENYLIPSEAGGMKDLHNFRRRDYYPTLERLRIRKLTPHATRHTFASLMSKAGVRPELLQQIIGHADYSTTANIYVHTDLGQLKNAIDEI